MADEDTSMAAAHGSSGRQKARGQPRKCESNLCFFGGEGGGYLMAKPRGPLSTAIRHHCPESPPGDGTPQETEGPSVDSVATRKGPKHRPPSRCPPGSGSTWPRSPGSLTSSSSSCHPRSCPFSTRWTRDVSQDPLQGRHRPTDHSDLAIGSPRVNWWDQMGERRVPSPSPPFCI